VDEFEALALIGALTGPPAAVAQIVSVVRDRPRVRVSFGTVDELGKPPRVWVSVLNHGRQPVTVREAGFYGSEMPIEVLSQEHGPMTGTGRYELRVISEPILLDPGRLHRVESTVPDAVEFGYHVDFPLRVYADDARGQRIWGKAAPVTRMLVGGGPCPQDFPPYLWDPTSEPLEPARVEPRWKLWTRRELRRGKAGRPSSDELIEATSPARRTRAA
jgi:hypothetical protein